MANATGLDLVSPPEFMQAVSEGNDPSAQSITQFQQLLQHGNVTLLVYNHQTITPLTENIKSLATQKGIPTVGVTETIQPPNLSFQDWVNSQLTSIQSALNYSKMQQTLE
jgi:zinc/manganese transport system substrate-binding protein